MGRRLTLIFAELGAERQRADGRLLSLIQAIKNQSAIGCLNEDKYDACKQGN